MRRYKQWTWAGAVVGILAAAGGAPAKGAPPVQSSDAKDTSIRIGETAVGMAGGCKIGVGNIFVDKFTDEAGAQTEGPRASLTIFGPPPCQSKTVRVHKGQRIQVGEQWFLVAGIDKPPAGRGAVQLTATVKPK